MKLSHVLLSVTFLLSVCAVSESQLPAPLSSDAGSERISVTIATKQGTFKVGDNILLSITVKNISEGIYCEGHYLETGEAELNGYDVHIINSNGTTYSIKPIERGRLKRSRGKVCINPGGNLKEKLSVEQLVDLSAPGVYQIQVDHHDREANIRVRSNSITVTVMP
jgi:hypothetical protein